MNCKGRRYLLNFCVGLLGGDGQGEWATFCTIVWWSNGGLKGKPPVDGQHVCLADAERSSSQPKTNEYWGYAWLFLALITNYIRLYSWKWVKILLRPFWSHFTYPQSKILSPFKMAFAIRRPTPPLNGKISRHFFTPLFFFCNWILHIWNGFYTSKISLLSPLIIGSKLTFISSSGRWLPTI